MSRDQYPGTPRWAIVSGIVAIVLLVVLVVVMLLGGDRHGPQRHLSAGYSIDRQAGVAAAEVIAAHRAR